MKQGRDRHAIAWRIGGVCVLVGAALAGGCKARETTASSATVADAPPAETTAGASPRYGVQGPKGESADGKESPADKRAAALQEAAEFGTIGVLPSKPSNAGNEGGFGIGVGLSGYGYGGGGTGNESLSGHGGARAGASLSAGAMAGGGAPAARRIDPLTIERPAARLDPNARYATTYRPGGASLAAFDTAIARGDMPAVYKDLVGDFAARYAPEIKKPEVAALAFQIDTERAAVPPSGGSLNLRVAMRSSDGASARAPLSVHLVLDVSGSMEGAAIAHAREAAAQLVGRLEPADAFSLVTFSSSASVLVKRGPIGPRRRDVLRTIEGIKTEGGTNISAGLDLGYAEAHADAASPDAVKIVMLLSDGHANAGDTRAAALADRSARALQDGVQTSTFGLGQAFDATVMSALAERGAGGYYYLADGAQIAGALARELDARLVPVAQAIEVRVRLRPDVTPTKVFGSRELGALEAERVRAQEVAVDRNVQKHDGIAADRQTDAEGGMRFFMPAFARSDRHALLLTLALPRGTGERAIGSIEVRYKDRVRKKNVTEEIPVRIRYAASDAESASTTNASVARSLQAFAAGDAILEAAARVDMGDRAGARRLLDERAALLVHVAESAREPAFKEDAVRLARLARAVDGDARVEGALTLSMLLRGSGSGYLQ